MWLVIVMSFCLMAFTAYIISWAMGQRLIAQIVVAVSIFTIISVTAQAIMPAYERMQERIERTNERIDRFTEAVERMQFWRK
jgi:type II secretory pathway component PulJ